MWVGDEGECWCPGFLAFLMPITEIRNIFLLKSDKKGNIKLGQQPMYITNRIKIRTTCSFL